MRASVAASLICFWARAKASPSVIQILLWKIRTLPVIPSPECRLVGTTRCGLPFAGTPTVWPVGSVVRLTGRLALMVLFLKWTHRTLPQGAQDGPQAVGVS